MARVIVLGAGTGGMAGAYEIREILNKEHQVTVINDREDFQFVPSNPWIAVGWRDRPEVSFPIRPYLEKKGIEFIASAAVSIDAKANKIALANGDVEEYDYLVICTGPKLNFAAVEGAGPHGGFTQSVCTLDHSESCYDNVKALIDDHMIFNYVTQWSLEHPTIDSTDTFRYTDYDGFLAFLKKEKFEYRSDAEKMLEKLAGIADEETVNIEAEAKMIRTKLDAAQAEEAVGTGGESVWTEKPKAEITKEDEFEEYFAGMFP